jgi:hypothetical protein
MRRLRVLLLTSKRELKPDTQIIGNNIESPFGNKEIENYIMLLCACNIPFDIKYDHDLSFENIIFGGNINYSTIILTLPANQLSQQNVNLIDQVSHDYGISIIASYNRIDDTSKHIFGVDVIKKWKFSIPCIISVMRDKFLDDGIDSETSLGDGWRISFDRWGLRRHPIRYLKKHVKKFWKQVFIYRQVEIYPDTEKLSLIKKTSDPAILRYKYGRANNYYISLQPDRYLNQLNALHRIIREIIKENSGWGMVHTNLENTMVLRMDDPGTCERVYLKGWDTGILDREDWQGIINLIKENNARLSVMYIPLWVDDGNLDNGRLYVKGEEVVNRKGGEIYQSRDVKFIKNVTQNESRVYDYSEEFYALKDAVRSGWVEIEAHGLTHVDINTDQWLAAKDRYTNFEWYHEFRHVCENRDVGDAELSYIFSESAKKVEECFGIFPTAVTPSGHEQSEKAEIIAHAEGYKLFSSEYHSIKKNDFVIRNDKIKSIFFEATSPDPFYVTAGYPIVGIFHDTDIITKGLNWLESTIKDWKKYGINRFMSLKELVGYICSSINAYQDQNRLYIMVDISETGDVSNALESRYFSNHEMEIYITVPEGTILKNIEISGKIYNDYEYDKRVRKIRLTLPPFQSKHEQKILITFE